MATGPTLRQFEKQLRKALARVRRIQLRRHPRHAGEIHYSEDGIEVLWVDPFWRGIGPTVVHELIHFERRAGDGTRGELDEPETLGTEEAMWALIKDDPRLYPWWRRNIYRRLPRSIKGD
jgi:hypothetical protein